MAIRKGGPKSKDPTDFKEHPNASSNPMAADQHAAVATVKTRSWRIRRLFENIAVIDSSQVWQKSFEHKQTVFCSNKFDGWVKLFHFWFWSRSSCKLVWAFHCVGDVLCQRGERFCFQLCNERWFYKSEFLKKVIKPRHVFIAISLHTIPLRKCNQQ